MTKQHQPLYLSPEATATLLELAAALRTVNQRGEASISALDEHIGRTAAGAWAETVAALEIAAGCAAGGDWDELIEAIWPQYNE